ncbi:exodeoxyribonuclease VII small subunit [Lentilactobacillus hilgardii]|uniref:Exodeoxyribonuclease 7 small subunit n=2 Tax=Lentilactobacillus hilgardii TaxID=1588 RepID=C0XM76_LENH9|nr:exodeoxyribonuclease VII, small subunit [Lentilactobacillus buchneri ATCC 11577]EEI23424.1 exodeoxyribonuclease VII, small subunit [Lentilactobacillus hilgardii DSM 20176 = ATCC 8290]MCP9332089.1 exodeoxyribonuclease VII small subunit [Lentilactobacillus hilgardii]KRK58447.1 exodeoxyribonuclease VII, small subunit [Lentilactobacillus hilgardii DSM 20176 = ATCC 8290]MCP9348656.1 exodeoxyribonuclease VII small subunit [Lentilactobacillus hilgardii]
MKMMADSQSNETFEQKMDKLEQIVNQLEQGNVSLEESMDKFKTGIKLSEELQETLTKAEHTMAKMMDKDGNEVQFESPDNTKDDNNGNQAQ